MTCHVTRVPNKDQRNLVKAKSLTLSPGKSEIICFVSRKQLRVLSGRSTPKFSISLGARDPHLTVCHWTPQHTY